MSAPSLPLPPSAANRQRPATIKAHRLSNGNGMRVVAVALNTAAADL
jgi:hypothetical protein